MLNLQSTLIRVAVATVVASPSLAFAALASNRVPEPGSWALVGLGLVAVIATRIKRRK